MPPALSVEKTLKRAARAVKSGDAAGAEALFRDVLDRYPGNARARRGLRALGQGAAVDLIRSAQTLQDSGALDAAEAKWADAARLAPENAATGLALALCRLDLGRPAMALAAVDTVLAHHPENPAAQDIKGRALRDLGQAEAAETWHRRALGHGAADASPLNHLGILAQARGDRTDAAEYFRQAIALRPDQADLHQNLSRAITYRPGEPHLCQMQRCLNAADPNDATRAPLHFAMFKALDDLDDRAAAFAHLATGNALRRAVSRYDVRRDAARFAFCKALFADDVPPPASATGASLRPVFVVGLPRSGTTLVERILAQTPGAHAAGELPVVATAVARLLRTLQDRETPALGARDIAALRAELLDGLARRAGVATVIIDKMPLNFRWIGFVAAALPEARIVHVARDPMPLAWSLYRHAFGGHGNGFAYDIADIAAYMVLHRATMQFWRTRFGGRVFDLDYGDLVADPATAIPALVDACGLDWAPDCLTPHRATGPVLTASAAQVRQPIHATSDAGWRRYETHLAPLRHALTMGGLM